jgi:hypothetical protein
MPRVYPATVRRQIVARYDRTLWTDLTSLRFLDAAHGAVVLGAPEAG